MLSFIGASMMLPFLPMSPLQILLNNYLFEVTQTAYPGDNVDKENLRIPHRWDIRFLVKFMLFFGTIAAFFNFLMFGILWFLFQGNVNVSLFQTGWFIETLFAELLLIFAIRTKKVPFLRSFPSKPLLALIGGILVLVLLLPFTPLAPILQLARLPILFYPTMFLVVLCFLSITWYLKNWFFEQIKK
jgi:Mg2+-importing ATPase